MKKIICLIGESAVGKDSLKEALLKLNEHCASVVRYTTRPKREHEISKINYHYVTDKEFESLILDSSMLEAEIFRGWAYGTTYDSLVDDKVNILTCDCNAAENLSHYDNLDVEIIWISAKPRTRLIRALTREDEVDVDEVLRRFKADNEKYADFKERNKNWYFFINEKEEDFERVLSMINEIVEVMYETGNL